VARIRILYDNKSAGDALRPGWGFSALIEHDGKSLLFDVGADVLVFKHNVRALGVDLKATDALIVSHEHCDHIGAISVALHRDLDVYYPASFSSQFKKEIGDERRKPLWTPHPVTDPLTIVPGVRSTGELKGRGGIVEQGLIVDGKEGTVLVTGCAHPGIVGMVKVAADIADRCPQLVLGGFHLLRKKRAEVLEIAAELKGLGVKKIGPCHCTGDRAIATFAESFSQSFIDVRTGVEIVVR